MVENVGADATIASVMPVNAWITEGIGTSGSTSVLHSRMCTAPTSSRFHANDADLGDPVSPRARSRGFQVDEGEGGGRKH